MSETHTSAVANGEPSVGREVAAALLVPAAAFGFARVFEQTSAVVPILGAALLSTALAVAMRRLRVPLPLAILGSLIGLALVMVNRYAPGTSRLGVVPTGESLDQLQLLLDDGVEQFRKLRAPVPDLPPFIAASMGAAWIMAFLTDWGALRLRLAFEPVLPASLLFIFSAVLGAGNSRLSSTLVFAAAVLLWAVAQRVESLTSGSAWLTADRQRGPVGVAQSAAAIGLVAVLLGAFLGPRIPGAGEEELYYWRTRTDPTRTVVSPFVEIGSRLVEQKDIDLFKVTSERRSYWRLSGLDEYDAERASWITSGRFETETDSLPGLRTSAGSTVAVQQQIEIQGLGGIFLPAAFAPSRIVESNDEVAWNAESGALAVKDDGNDSETDGAAYVIESVLPLHTPAELNAIDEVVPPEIAERYLKLPVDLTPVVAEEAIAITQAAGATTRYEQALALQEHFRAFDYSLNLSRRTDDPIEQFLEERVGFCQQFSGTFALMARSLGIPARVAVGFTWGDPVDGEPNTYQVTGRHTHAWPEVWFDDLGWVAFEPTPTRGAPDAAYTGVAAAQDSLSEGDLTNPTTSTTSPDLGSSTTEFDPAAALGDEFTLDPGADLGGGLTDQGGLSVPFRFVLPALLLAAYLFGVPALHNLRRANRLRRADSAAGVINARWRNIGDDLERAFGLERDPSETRHEFARRAQRNRWVPDEPIASLASAVTTARYAGSGVNASLASEAELAAQEIDRAIRRREGTRGRWLSLIDPRRIVRNLIRRLRSGPSLA